MIFDELKDAVMDGDTELVEELCEKVLSDKINAVDAVEKGLIKGIEAVGRLWTEGEMFLPDVMMGADALKAGLDILETELAKAKATSGDDDTKRKIVIGTVKGDIHDIGKNICVAMLIANGFDVYDIGTEREVADFIKKAEEVGAEVIGASALLTTTMSEQKTLIDYMNEHGIRNKYKVLIGGGPTTQSWADEIGADGWGETANDAVVLCKKLMS